MQLLLCSIVSAAVIVVAVDVSHIEKRMAVIFVADAVVALDVSHIGKRMAVLFCRQG